METQTKEQGIISEVESILVIEWKKFLNVDVIDVHKDFFELGGHSLLAVQVTARIKKLFGIEIPMTLLFDEGNIKNVAYYVGMELHAAGRTVPPYPPK